MQEVRISNLMTKTITCISSGAKLKEVVRLMLQKECSCLIVTEMNMPIGIITESDLFPVLADLLDQPRSPINDASEIMSSPPVILNLSATLFKALAIARNRYVQHFPVVNAEGEAVGLVTRSDLDQAHFKVIESQREIIERAVISRTEELHKANYELKELALEDVFLGIGNRRAMEVDLQHTHDTALRYNRPYAIVLFEIDFFRQYHEAYGASEGNNALKTVACHLKGLIRHSDRLYRYGEGAFLLLLPETAAEQANTFARRIITSVSDLEIPNCESPSRIFTLSGGIGSEELGISEKNSWEEVLAESLDALAEAVKNGRNQIASDRQEASAEMSNPGL